MTRQQAWNTYEAVILLDAFLQYRDGNISRREAVQEVSKTLRKMAANQGLTIDDTFRNESGITFQLASMESAFEGRTIMKPSTQLFCDVVAIYRDNPNRYNTLLKEANAMSNGSEKSKEEFFLSWLSERVTPTQLSEYSEIYHSVQEFCNRLSSLRGSIYDVCDNERAKRIDFFK